MEKLMQEIASLEKELQTSGDRNEHMRISNLLSEKRNELVKLQEQQEQQAIVQEHEQRVTVVADQFDARLEKMDFGGMTLRQVIGGESEYQLVSIGLKKEFMGQADHFSKQIVDLQTVHSEQIRAANDRELQIQRQNENLQARVTQLTAELEETNRLFNLERSERAKAETARDNAVTQLDEQRAEVARLNSHIDDLRNEIALGARGAINVVDTEEEQRQKQALADKIRKERTIYNREWVDSIKQNRYKAKLAATGDAIEFPWTEKTKYFVIDESEVQQFREQYGVQSTDQIPSVVEASVPDGVAQGPQFPSAPNVGTVHAPDLATGNVSGQQARSEVAAGQGTDGETPVTRAEFETRLTQFREEFKYELMQHYRVGVTQ